MKNPILALTPLFVTLALACDETKSTAPAPGASSAPASVPAQSAAPVAAPAQAVKKKTASDCIAHPTVVDFSDDPALEREVRRKLNKDGGPLSPGDLAQIKSINLASVPGLQIQRLDPCIFPMFTSLKDLFLGAGEYDDLSPIQRLTTLESLRASLSRVKDLRPIEGLRRLDRLDVSHTLVADEDLKPVGALTNLTELMLDEDPVADLSPLSSLKKLERLSIKKTRVKNLTPLASLRALKFLYIAETAVSDISPVQPLVANGMKLVQN